MGWPSYNPDLNPVDFFFRDYVEDRRYVSNLKNAKRTKTSHQEYYERDDWRRLIDPRIL